MEYFYLWAVGADKERHSYLVKMVRGTAGLFVSALHPWGYWVNDAWIYSAITFGWTGPASDCIEWNYEQLTEKQFNEALTKRGF